MVLIAVAAAGLVLGGIGWSVLRRRRRLIAARQTISASVVATTDEELVLRLPNDERTNVLVGPALAAHWRRQLAHGPGPFEEPDLADPSGWDQVLISYSPEGSPRALLSQTLDDTQTMPQVLMTLGALTAVSALLALSVPVLLAALGAATGVVAALLSVGLARTSRGVAPLALAVGVGLFLGGAAIAMIVAAITWT